jgi:hypothetical protein
MAAKSCSSSVKAARQDAHASKCERKSRDGAETVAAASVSASL